MILGTKRLLIPIWFPKYMNLLLPETYVKDLNAPLIFLAGPIKGGGMWQDYAIEIINSADHDLYIASPHQKQRQYLWEN